MALILHIDTATVNAVVGISENERVIDFLTNNNQKDHASFVQPAIKQLLQKNNISIQQLNAVSVTEGPGSYTGLRVGMASAKGLCYALNIPLLALSTLKVMALSVIEHTTQPELYLYCPMIDARRVEVFTGLYDNELNEILPASSVILVATYLNDILQKKKIIFLGNGAQKFINLSHHSNIIFSEEPISTSALAAISTKKFNEKNFADLHRADSIYIKPFFTTYKL